jgi:hypothetical protein
MAATTVVADADLAVATVANKLTVAIIAVYARRFQKIIRPLGRNILALGAIFFRFSFACDRIGLKSIVSAKTISRKKSRFPMADSLLDRRDFETAPSHFDYPGAAFRGSGALSVGASQRRERRFRCFFVLGLQRPGMIFHAFLILARKLLIPIAERRCQPKAV